MGVHPGLQGCEWTVFHGSINEALPLLEDAQAGGGPEGPRLTWLTAVTLGACGRYGEALALLDSFDTGATEYSMAMSLKASLLRQLGCHDLARQADSKAMSKASTAGSAMEAMTGLAADAVGLNVPDEAVASIERAGELLEQMLNTGGTEAAWWRHHIRVEWVRCEIALMQSRFDEAAAHAGRALELAETANAPRHVAKSLLFLAVAQIEQGRQQEAQAQLNRAIVLSASMGYLAGAWPAHAVLAELIRDTDPERSRQHFAEAARITSLIGEGLSEPLAQRWRSRPDIARLSAAAAGQS